MEEMMNANQAKMNANLKEMREKIKFGQTEMKSVVSAMRSELEYVNKKTQDLHKELTDKIERKTQVELQTVEVSPNKQTRKLRKDLAAIRSDYLRDYDLTYVMVQATFNKTRSAIEVTECEFQAQLEVIQARAEQRR
jgi:hypothetical protein